MKRRNFLKCVALATPGSGVLAAWDEYCEHVPATEPTPTRQPCIWRCPPCPLREALRSAKAGDTVLVTGQHRFTPGILRERAVGVRLVIYKADVTLTETLYSECKGRPDDWQPGDYALYSTFLGPPQSHAFGCFGWTG